MFYPSKLDLVISSFISLLELFKYHPVMVLCHFRSKVGENGVPTNRCKVHLLKRLVVWVSGLQYSKTRVKQPLSERQKIGFQDQLSLNAGQKNCRMLQGEHSAILLTFIKLPFAINIFVLFIFSGRFTQILLYITHSEKKHYDQNH